ncbi:MAG: ADP-forming succinate--CoA ligase subunit beta [Candidatus Omnitrophica bacterium]|nr:ADP-forming succinate--CoA ligase subunit beta [Candidatus Omnitrophota bacterium]
MKVHEYQARLFLEKYGVPCSRGEVIFRAEEAPAAFKKFANPSAMAKVQVLAGGRGKAGGVLRLKTAEEASAFAQKFLGKPFATYQSGGEGKIVKAILLTEDIPIREEYYLSVAVDRSKGAPVILFSKAGGVEIEETARASPGAVHKIYFSPDQVPAKSAILPFIQKVFSDPSVSEPFAAVAEKLARLFVEKDASVCEINPLVLSQDRRVMALDAKIVFDDNALFRHEDLRAMKDPDEEDARETRAKEFGLSYVSMNGNVGCLVNGAGLAMATMDVIKLAGGEPANFLDVGGGATADQVREGFKIILQDERVEAILVNIFGGIMKCDVIAEGVIQASKETGLQVPLIARLEGTRVEEGRALLKKSGLRILSSKTIREAAEAAVGEAKKYRESRVGTH